MTVDHATDTKPLEAPKTKLTYLAKRLDITARGLFFVWLGVAVLAQLGWGWSLTGIGLIFAGEQAARWRLALPISTKWAIGSAVFLVAGLWQLLHISFPLAPLLLILLGVAVLWRGFFSSGENGGA